MRCRGLGYRIHHLYTGESTCFSAVNIVKTAVRAQLGLSVTSVSHPARLPDPPPLPPLRGAGRGRQDRGQHAPDISYLTIMSDVGRLRLGVHL